MNIIHISLCARRAGSCVTCRGGGGGGSIVSYSVYQKTNFSLISYPKIHLQF